LSHRWAGTSFVVLHWRSWTAVDWIAALLAVMAAFGLLGGTVIAVMGANLGPHLALAHYWAVPGAGLECAAAALMVWSQLTMGSSWRVGVDRTEATRLITNGPFRWVRNPIYSAMVTLGIGLAMLVSSIYTVLGTVAMAAFVEWQVRAVEEPYLVSRHERDYARWSATSGRFIPLVGRLRSSTSGSRQASISTS
jgi:protein-S-isoprenylcysteine O-methyltransferase Ste14